jgi:hypothetical protein
MVAVASAARAQTPGQSSGREPRPASAQPLRPSSGQARGTTGASPAKWATPRTPWGDPDLQGTYTNKYETSTPFERPKEFEGRRIADVTPDELAAAVRRRQQDTLARAKFFGGDPEGRIGNSAEFRDIYEIERGSRPWFVVEPADGLIPQVRPEARARIAALPRAGGSFGNGPFNGPEDFSLWDRCITRGLPGSMLPGQYGNSYQIVQGPGFVAIRYEMVHDTRIIPLDPVSRNGSTPFLGRPHAGKAIALDMGDARGYWEGDTLVVETTNFKARSIYRNANPETLRLVERFTMTAADTVEWSVTVDDATTWTRPWTFSIPLTMNEREPVFEYACHEGNQAIRNILSAARSAEKESVK